MREVVKPNSVNESELLEIFRILEFNEKLIESSLSSSLSNLLSQV